MTERIDENPPMSIPEQAAEWLLRWHCGDLSIAERFAYLQWLKTSPVHIAETLRMCRLYSWLENTKLKLFITNEDSFSNVVELPPREREAVAARGASRSGLWRVRIAAGAAAIGLAAVVGFAAKIVWFDHTLQTQASEWRSVPLSDGSSVTAVPYTKLHHKIGDDQRVITLAQGSATFRVAKDPSRPFLVEAGGVVVTATGTEFGVELDGNDVTVTVSEGSVAVSPAPDSSVEFAPVPVHVDYQLTMSSGREPVILPVNAEESLAWARKVLVFKEGSRIGDAVARFNKYNGTKIVVDDAMAALQWRGVFHANDPASFAETVGQMTGGTLVRERPEKLRIQTTSERNH
jgi:transmembrane sensor